MRHTLRQKNDLTSLKPHYNFVLKSKKGHMDMEERMGINLNPK